MIGKQMEKRFGFTMDQPNRQAPAGRLNLLPRLITVCAWCKGTQNADGAWRHAEYDPQIDTETAVSHGICPECAERTYSDYRLATFRANSHLASSPRAA